MATKAIVKSVNSGDSLVLRTRSPSGQPQKDRLLHLADITAPRIGTSMRDDEDWAFESREFLRARLVGKEISFTSLHSLPAGEDGTLRDLGAAEIQIGGVPADLALEILRNGWATIKENKGRDREGVSEDEAKKKEVEAQARAAGKGVWSAEEVPRRSVQHNMPLDPHAFLTEWKGKTVNGIVESVRDGSMLRVRLLLPNGDHQFINVSLAGVRCARTATKQGEAAEQWADEAKQFTETRLLQRPVHVELLSLPAPSAAPFHSTSNGSAPTPPSYFIGNVLHTAGNIAEHLVSNGLARVVDWHAGMLAASGTMERLRASERTAKERRLCLYANTPASGSSARSNGAGGVGVPSEGRSFEGTVVRIWSGDQISVVSKDGANLKERRLQLSSTRAPKATADAKQSYYAAEAREFLRKKLIGKTVRVHIDFIRPREGEFEERECATVRYGGNNGNIAEQLIEKGLATALRHKRDDEDRSPDYDKLTAAEQVAAAEGRGLHSEKDHPPPKPPMNISESATRANSFLSGFKRLGRIPAIVDYVAAGSRFKILLPKDNQSFTLVLGGIRAPRSGRGKDDKGEPFGSEAAEFATRRYMQRDVEVEVDAVDKNGGFIGALYMNKAENAAITLVKEGLATVHSFSAEGLGYAKHLFDAEAEAKESKRNIWQEYDAEAERAAEEQQNQSDDTLPLKAEYMDVIISDVRTKSGLSFSVQILNTEGIASLEKLMREFSLHHRQAVVPSASNPKNGDLVSAKFSDGSWYRAKVRRASPMKKEAEVTFIDYGNQDTVAFKDIRPLDVKFRSLPGQAQDARLSFVKFADPSTDYYAEGIERFRSLCEGRKLVANIDHREGTLLHLRLIDPSDSSAAKDPNACVNVDLVREGLASIDRKGCRYLQAYPTVAKKLREAVTGAKADRLGMYEFGDVDEDDD